MKRLQKRNKITVLLTLLAVVFLGAVYVFIYIPNNEQKLQAQRFRSLQNINKNIHEKIVNSVALLNNLLKPDAGVAYINHLNKLSKDNFQIGIPVADGYPPQTTDTITDGGYNIITNDRSKELMIQVFKKTRNTGGDTSTYTREMKFTYQQFFSPLLPKDVFTHYVVFKNAHPVYGTLPFNSDLRDTVFEKDNKIVSSSVRNYSISGIDYKLFLQPVGFIAENEWAVAGLLSNNRYQQERNQLPSNVILLMVTILLTLIVSFPLIKLYQMGSKDRLTFADGIASIIVAMLLMSLLFFILFKHNTQLRHNQLKDSKAVLARQIDSAFQNEIDTIYKRLHFIDSTVAANDNFFAGYINDTLSAQPESSLQLQLLKIKKDAKIRQVFWLDNAGNELKNWSSETEKAPKGNFKERGYVKNVIEQKDYFLHSDKRFYLDQVISWTTGNFTSVLSIPSSVKKDGAAIVAAAFIMRSLHNPVLPTGYQFAFIDKNGRVLYHSDTTRNLNENLSSEFSKSDWLISNLEAKTVDAFTTGYFGKNHFVLVTPIKRLPYFIVVFSDSSYNETRDTAIYFFTASMLFLLFGFSLLHLVFVFVVSSKKTFFKKQAYDTAWIGPKISAHGEYNLAIFLNLFVIFLALLFYAVSTFLTYIFILLFSITALSLFLNLLFARKYKIVKPNHYGFKKTTCLWLIALMAAIEIAALKLLDTGNSVLLGIYQAVVIISGYFFYTRGEAIIQKIKAAVNNRATTVAEVKTNVTEVDASVKNIAAGIAALTTAVAPNNAGVNKVKTVVAEINTIVNKIKAAVSKVDDTIKKAKADVTASRKITRNKLLTRWTYKQSFALMVLTRLIITSGIPVAFFYISAYNYEQNISIRYRQLQYANKLKDRLDAKGLEKITSNTSFDKGYYLDSSFVKNISVGTEGPVYTRSEEDEVTSKILDRFRINFTELTVKEDKFSTPYAADSLFGFNPLLKDACKKDSATKTYLKINAAGEYLAVQSAPLNYTLPSAFSRSWLNGILFWLLLLVALTVFYFIIHNVISKIFCLNLPNLTLCAGLDAKIIKNPSINNLLFVIGLPGSGKLNRVIEKITNGEIKSRSGVQLIYDKSHPGLSNVFVADLINIPDLGSEESRTATWQHYAKKVFHEKNRLIIINHFEYNIQCEITNRIKLNFLEQLMLENRCKIIILSTVHPVAFLDSVSDPTTNKEIIVPGQDLERWHVLLGHFRIVVFPLRHVQTPPYLKPEYKSLFKETERTHFLNKMRAPVIAEARELGEKNIYLRPEELIFKTQMNAHYFYMYIWQSLTKEEKFLLYDLAEDNLVNGYDDYNLNMLLAKGAIIRHNGTLMLFNQGFRNFILTAIGNAEVMKLKNQIRENGNWSRLKLPLFIVLMAILTFLLASQKEAYSDMMTYVAALGTAIPALLRLFSNFSTTEKKA